MYMNISYLKKKVGTVYFCTQDIKVFKSNPSYIMYILRCLFFSSHIQQNRNLNEDVRISVSINNADCTLHEYANLHENVGC